MTHDWLRKRSSIPVLMGLLIIPLVTSDLCRDPFVGPKWAAFYLLALLCFSWRFVTALREGFSFPSLSPFSWGIVLLLLGGFIASTLTHPGHFENQVLDWGCFLLLLFSAYFAFLECPGWKSEALLFCGISLCLVLLGSSLEWSGVWRSDGSLLGNPNLLGEFLAVGWITLTLEIRRESSKLKFIQIALIGTTLVFLLKLCCRGVLLSLPAAFALAACLGCFKSRSSLKSARSKVLFLIATLFLLCGIQAGSLFGKSSVLQLNKRNSMNFRWVRWQNTLRMIQEYPLWGVGPGNFEFTYPLAQGRTIPDEEVLETMVIRSPHNGYLELMVEYGIPYFVLFGIVLVIGIRKIWALNQDPETSDEIRLRLRYGTLILGFNLFDALFGFPMESPFPFYAAALAGGALGSVILKPTRQSLFGWVALSMLGLTISILTGDFLYAKWVEGKEQPTYSHLSRACRFFPSLWQNCIQKAEWEVQVNDYSRGIETAQKLINAYPGLYPAIGILGPAQVLNLQQEEGCRNLATYDQILHGHHRYRTFARLFCQYMK